MCVCVSCITVSLVVWTELMVPGVIPSPPVWTPKDSPGAYNVEG